MPFRKAGENTEFFRQLIDTIPGGIAVFEAVDDGRDFIFLDVNRAVEVIEGAGRDTMLGRRVTEIFPGIEEFGLLEVLRRVWDTGRPEHLAPAFYQDPRRSGWREYYVYRLPDGEIMAIYNDVSELMETRLEFERSEARYRDLYENAPDGFASVDAATGTIRCCNATLARMLGREKEELEGRPVLELYHPEARADAEHTLRIFRETGRVRNAELRMQCADGSPLDIMLNVSAVRDEQGAIIESRSAVRDISELKTAQEELRRYETILSWSTDLMYLLDSAYSYLAVNNAYLQYYLTTRDTLLGHTVEEIMGPEVFTRLFKAHLDRCLAGETIRDDAWFDYPGPGRRYMEMTYSPYLRTDGSIGGIVVNARDLTDWREAQDERIRLQERLKQAEKLESLGVLAGGIAHDFNNLLTAILGHADLALQLTDPASQVHRNLETVVYSSRKAAELVGQMLAYAGRGKFLLRRTTLAEIARETADTLRDQLPAAVTLTLVPDAAPDPVTVDPAQIRQAIRNLILNAREACEGSGGTITIATGCMRCGPDEELCQGIVADGEPPEGEFTWIEVSDTGPGMDEETAARAFEPFFSTRFVGRGLGLPAVLGIVRSHEGCVLMKSVEGEGTTVRLLFPIRPADA